MIKQKIIKVRNKITKKFVLDNLNNRKSEMNKLTIKKIGLFGSVLKGSNNEKSDIDLIVEFKIPSFDNYAETLIFLEKLLKKRIDLVTESSLRPELNYVKKEAEYVRL